MVERVAHARAEAQRETFDRLAHEFTEARCAALDGLLITDPEIRMTRLRWLATGPVEASPAAVKAEVAKLEFEADFPHTGPLLTRKLNTDLIAEHYDDLLRLAGSLKFGHVTASLLVGKLSAAGRQNALAAALKEYGTQRRTIYAARYLADPAYRRKISRQLNKGESLHALKRDLLYAHEGAIRARHLEAQTEQAWCLTLATNAVVACYPGWEEAVCNAA
ncbi:hypothetical protein GCM10010160_41430 [Acrocarpospora corrugata]